MVGLQSTSLRAPLILSGPVDAQGTGLKLATSDLRTFVSFGVRTKSNGCLLRVARHL